MRDDYRGGLRIDRVEAMYKDSLDIQLSNGNVILLQTALILALPGFGQLAEDDRILYPKTDGECVYWRDGPRLSVNEVLALTGDDKKEATI